MICGVEIYVDFIKNHFHADTLMIEEEEEYEFEEKREFNSRPPARLEMRDSSPGKLFQYYLFTLVLIRS